MSFNNATAGGGGSVVMMAVSFLQETSIDNVIIGNNNPGRIYLGL